MTVSSPFGFKSQGSKSSLFNPEANHQTMERKCWMDWGTPSPPGLTFSAHFLSFQDVHVCWTTLSFSMRWGTRLLGGQQQSEVNCKQSVYNLKERSSYPFTPIWKTVMGSLGSRVLSLTQSLYPVGCGTYSASLDPCPPGLQDSVQLAAPETSWRWQWFSGKEERKAGSQKAKDVNCTSPDHPGLPWWLSGKESTCNARDKGFIPESGRSPGERNGSPLQYSCLRNPMGRGAWRATVHGVAKSWTWLHD